MAEAAAGPAAARLVARDEALRAVLDVAEAREAAVFVGNGNNARAVAALTDYPRVFFMVGSMSLGPSIAAGFSMCGGQPTFVVEGDGNALMGLSALPVVAAASRGPFVHVVLDNGTYETTGAQRTLSDRVRLSDVASAAGYERCLDLADGDLASLSAWLTEAAAGAARCYAHVRTAPDPGPKHPRVPLHPRDIPARFRAAVGTGA